MLKKIKEKKWRIKIHPKNSKSVYHYQIGFWHLIIINLFLLSLFLLPFYFNNNKIQKQKARIQILTKEKEHLSKVLIKQNKALQNKIEKVEKQNNEIKKILGIKPFKKYHKSLRASRGGIFLNKYWNFKEKLENLSKEQIFLRMSALKYKKKKNLERKIRALEEIPSIWPAGGYISSSFGWRLHPIYGVNDFHSGVDIIAPYGAPIYSAAGGEVVFAGYEGGYGYTIKIKHSQGLETLYGHCSSIIVFSGQKVKQRELIGYVGSSGMTTGPHLHYEISCFGIKQNPESYLNTKNKLISQINKVK
ncbi:MAG: M23 family metallopeptidase [Armatimonadetes bacterium]|nr:M23 family metallopeptidase [Armatimonadota bacterium]